MTLGTRRHDEGAPFSGESSAWSARCVVVASYEKGLFLKLPGLLGNEASDQERENDGDHDEKPGRAKGEDQDRSHGEYRNGRENPRDLF